MSGQFKQWFDDMQERYQQYYGGYEDLLQEAFEAGAAKAWAAGYQQGVEDERTSEANIGIAGFGMKVEPARENPYAIRARA
jgi:flagellar biosynthesis/type III secretory pathway protein FliH